MGGWGDSSSESPTHPAKDWRVNLTCQTTMKACPSNPANPTRTMKYNLTLKRNCPPSSPVANRQFLRTPAQTMPIGLPGKYCLNSVIRTILACIIFIAANSVALMSVAADPGKSQGWLGFRGDGTSSGSSSAPSDLKLGDGGNLYKLEMPGRSVAGPIVIGDLVVTTGSAARMVRYSTSVVSA